MSLNLTHILRFINRGLTRNRHTYEAMFSLVRMRALGQKALAAVLSLCLLWTSGNVAEAALLVPNILARPALPPQFELVPPPTLGRIADYYNSPTAVPSSEVRLSGSKNSKLVVLIQDLHAHYGAQKNIAGLLEFLTEKLASPSLRPPS